MPELDVKLEFDGIEEDIKPVISTQLETEAQPDAKPSLDHFGEDVKPVIKTEHDTVSKPDPDSTEADDKPVIKTEAKDEFESKIGRAHV